MAQKLDIGRVLRAVNNRDRKFYANLTEEEQAAFVPFVLLRYTGNPEGGQDYMEWFLESTHEYANKNMWDISKNHKELVWLLFSAVGLGQNCRHTYLAAPGRTKTDKFESFLIQQTPSMKSDDAAVMAGLMTKKDRLAYINSFGITGKEAEKFL